MNSLYYIGQIAGVLPSYLSYRRAPVIVPIVYVLDCLRMHYDVVTHPAKMCNACREVVWSKQHQDVRTRRGAFIRTSSHHIASQQTNTINTTLCLQLLLFILYVLLLRPQMFSRAPTTTTTAAALASTPLKTHSSPFNHMHTQTSKPSSVLIVVAVVVVAPRDDAHCTFCSLSRLINLFGLFIIIALLLLYICASVCLSNIHTSRGNKHQLKKE